MDPSRRREEQYAEHWGGTDSIMWASYLVETPPSLETEDEAEESALHLWTLFISLCVSSVWGFCCIEWLAGCAGLGWAPADTAGCLQWHLTEMGCLSGIGVYWRSCAVTPLTAWHKEDEFRVQNRLLGSVTAGPVLRRRGPVTSVFHHHQFPPAALSYFPFDDMTDMTQSPSQWGQHVTGQGASEMDRGIWGGRGGDA